MEQQRSAERHDGFLDVSKAQKVLSLRVSCNSRDETAERTHTHYPMETSVNGVQDSPRHVTDGAAAGGCGLKSKQSVDWVDLYCKG